MAQLTYAQYLCVWDDGGEDWVKEPFLRLDENRMPSHEIEEMINEFLQEELENLHL